MIGSKSERPGRTGGDHIASGWRTALLAGGAGLLLAGQVGTADAQYWRSLQYRTDAPPNRVDQPGSRRSAGEKSKSKKKDVAGRHPFGENMPKGPLQLMISINDQRAVLYSNGVRVADTRVSTGVPEHPTPTGVFSIIQKNRWHRSNIYSNAPMYYMHRLTWSGVALHEGYLPGHAASHGCIRMPTDFVSRLWGVSKLGMRVIVARAQLTPHDFAHDKLFNPAQKPADTSRTSQAPAELRPALNTAGQGTAGQGHVRVAEAQPGAGAASDAPNAAETPSHPNAADAATAGAPSTLPAAAADVATTPAGPASAASQPVATAPAVIPAAAQVPVPDASATAPAAAEPDKPAIDPNELELPRPAPPRPRAGEPTKLNGQVAVFISGKEKRVYVRQAFVPVFDMPIEIANPGKPLGTHTFTALETVDGGARMRWNLVSMPLTAGQAASASKKGAQPQRRPKSARGAVITSDSSNAAEALDRVTIPQEAIDRIQELLTPGSSLIISDEGLGRETGRYTEFIVETR